MRYRFIDRIMAVDARAATIRACKVFPRSEEYFDGTFRREAEVPSSLVLEAMATAASLLLASRSRYEAHGILLKVSRAAFLRPVLAGDRMIVDAELRAVQGNWNLEAGAAGSGMAQIVARSRVEELPVAEADLLFLCVPMAWSLGSGFEREVTDLLDLIGAADTRP